MSTNLKRIFLVAGVATSALLVAGPAFANNHKKRVGHSGYAMHAGHHGARAPAIVHRGHFNGARTARRGIAFGVAAGYAYGGAAQYAEPAYAEPAYAPALYHQPQTYTRTYQVPTTVYQNVTQNYQVPVRSYQTVTRNEQVAVQSYQTVHRTNYVPVTSYRQVQTAHQVPVTTYHTRSRFC